MIGAAQGTPPVLNFEQAQTVGEKLHGWMIELGKPLPVASDSLLLGDAVQFVLREAARLAPPPED